jgi:TetR/AcrR family transcriptional repressor of nem operon
MRYAVDHKEQTRAAILKAATRVFKKSGYQAGSVDKVMNAAGLTAGGFYAHFKSKDNLFAETLKQIMAEAKQNQEASIGPASNEQWMKSFIKRYLSPAHRSDVLNGCPMPPLVSEVSRSGKNSKAAFESNLRTWAQNVANHIPANVDIGKDDQALAIISLCVGGLSLSRAVADEDFSNKILSACRKLALAALD